MNILWDFFDVFLLEPILIVFAGASIIALVLGGLMLINPVLAARLTAPLNRWVSTEDHIDPLNRPISTERLAYRHHGLVGLLFSLGGMYMLAWRYLGYEPGEIARALTGIVDIDRAAAVWLVSSIGMMVTVGGILALLVGIVMVLRPSLLKPIEQWSNRWVATDKVLESLDQVRQRDSVSLFQQRVIGLLFVLGSLYVLINLGQRWV